MGFPISLDQVEKNTHALGTRELRIVFFIRVVGSLETMEDLSNLLHE
jgi:hypothetical protein